MIKLMPDTIIFFAALLIVLIAGFIYFYTKNKKLERLMDKVIEFLKNIVRAA